VRKVARSSLLKSKALRTYSSLGESENIPENSRVANFGWRREKNGVHLLSSIEEVKMRESTRTSREAVAEETQTGLIAILLGQGETPLGDKIFKRSINVKGHL